MNALCFAKKISTKGNPDTKPIACSGKDGIVAESCLGLCVK